MQDKYHVPWDQFIVALKLLQVHVQVYEAQTRVRTIRVWTELENEDALKAVLAGYGLYRAKRVGMVRPCAYDIDRSRFTGVPYDFSSMILGG